MRRRELLLAVGAAAVGLGLLGMQQPEKPADTSAQPPAQAAVPVDRAALRARLERRLEEAKRVEDRIQTAIRRLDGGESPQQVQADVGEGRGGRRDHAGQGDHRNGDKSPDSQRHLEPAETLAAIQTYNAPAAERLRTLMKDNPVIGARIVSRLEPQVREIQNERDAETRDLRIAELNNGFETLAGMRQRGDAARAGQPTAELDGKLRQLIGEHFDLQLKLREREIAKLEDRIKQLHEELEQRRPQREAFITERMEQLKRGPAHKSGEGRTEPGPAGSPSTGGGD